MLVRQVRILFPYLVGVLSSLYLFPTHAALESGAPGKGVMAGVVVFLFACAFIAEMIGILSPPIFTRLVLMALVTAGMTGPLLGLSDHLRARHALRTKLI